MSDISPCRGRCELNEDNICIGCYRTDGEIAFWTEMTLQEKLIILRRIKHDFMAETNLSSNKSMDRME